MYTVIGVIVGSLGIIFCLGVLFWNLFHQAKDYVNEVDSWESIIRLRNRMEWCRPPIEHWYELYLIYLLLGPLSSVTVGLIWPIPVIGGLIYGALYSMRYMKRINNKLASLKEG